jgi:hypothetical protein
MIYSTEIEKHMRVVYETLSEKEKRLYIACEAIKLGYGGKTYICKVFGCSHNTLRRGINELKEGSKIPKGKERFPGGGRKKR